MKLKRDSPEAADDRTCGLESPRMWAVYYGGVGNFMDTWLSGDEPRASNLKFKFNLFMSNGYVLSFDPFHGIGARTRGARMLETAEELFGSIYCC